MQSSPSIPVPTALARWGRAFLLVVALAAFALAPFPLCPVRLWFHQPCPGCGATRAILMALGGDLRGSFALHPLALPALGLVVPSLAWVVAGIGRDGAVPVLPRALRLAWTLFMALLIGVWIARFFGAFGGPAPV